MQNFPNFSKIENIHKEKAYSHSHFHREDIRSIFTGKIKPINFIKGDTILISELFEDCLSTGMNSKNGNEFIDPMRENDMIDLTERKYDNKKSISDNQIVKSLELSTKKEFEIYNKDNVNDERFLTNRANNQETTVPEGISTNAKQYPYSNRKNVTVSNFEGVPMWESKSQGLSEDSDQFQFDRNPNKHKTGHFLPKIFNIGAKCENHNNAFIYSWSYFQPFSFLTGVTKFGKKTNGILNYPSPTFIDTIEWQKKPDLSKSAVLYGMQIHDKEGLVLVDKEIMKKFKGIIGDMIKQIVKAAFGGPPISLKVQLFEPKSTLQRITDYWSHAPTLLTQAGQTEDPLQRMKLVIAFAIGGFYIPTKQLKPFNPLIGETFQGEFEDGAKVYVEHISHYPTVARYYITGEYYKLYGYLDFATDAERFGSRINVFQRGPINIEFPMLKNKNNVTEKMIYNLPNIKLFNASSEEGRSAIWLSTMVFADIKNNLKGIVKFGTNKNYIHGFEGYIISNPYDTIFTAKNKYDHLKEVKESDDAKLDYENKKMKNKIWSKVTGSWLKEVRFDGGEVLWDIDTNQPGWVRPNTNVLPSDGRFREDLMWLFRMFNATSESDKKTFMEFAQGWKSTIEQTQRAEREIKRKTRLKKK